MCGIAGILRLDGTPADAAAVQSMTNAIAHRGPDGQGIHVDGSAGLGHRRLSIIDLAGSPQPMCFEGRYWITYNGELYNFQELRTELEAAGCTFRTSGDTEVILAAWARWGDDCVTRFRGMFAFCVVDLVERRYLLARDHFGIKPLLYATQAGFLAFASEFAALKRCPGVDLSIDLQAIEWFLRLQYVPGPHTAYRGIRKLMPGHVISGRLDAPPAEPRRYWRIEFKHEAGVSDWLDRADTVIRDSVQAHLIADVPVGVFVSGGIDSSLVAAKVHELGAGPRFAFSMGFEDEAFSELPYAGQVASKLGIELITGTAREDFWPELPKLVAHYGEPFGDNSMIPTWQLAQLARRHVTVCLSGDAGDEAFAGYSSYVAFAALPKIREYWRRLKKRFSGEEMRAMFWALGRRLGGSPNLREWMRVMDYTGIERRRMLWRPEVAAGLDLSTPAPAFIAADLEAPRHEFAAYAQHMDFHTYLPGAILTKVDIATMYHGLEARTPLLDREVVGLAARLPLPQRLNGDVGKVILKDMLERVMGHEFVHRRKQGFGIPRKQWFLEGRPGRRMFEEQLESGVLDEWFDKSAIRRTLSEHSEKKDRSGIVWLLLVLSLWRNGTPLAVET